MANGTKRKRGDRTDSSDNRASPHRPNLGLANLQHHQNNPRGGSRRGSRSGGRGGSNSVPHSPIVVQPSPTAMSPPSVTPSKPQAQALPQVQAPPQHSAPPPTPTPQTSSHQQQQDPAIDISKIPAHNEYLRSDIVSSWKADGRAKLVQEASEQLVKGNWLQLAVIFDEVVQACLDQSVSAQELGSVVRDVLASSSPGPVDPVSIFLDTVSTLTDMGTPPASLKIMLETTGIDHHRMRSELENNLLTVLNLVRPTFSRVGIRKATHALYRQSNYNLLREETEGYSKLMTEYFTTVHNEPPSQEVVNETFQRVTALIGAFDLDVGRVLDVTLDVFANSLVKHTRFFVKLLRTSSWWPEMKVPHGIEWEESLVSTLPLWAAPGFGVWYYSEEQKDEQLRLRNQRDIQFWTHAKDNGIKAWFDLGARRITSSSSVLESLNVSDPLENASASDKKPSIPSDFENIQKWSQDWMAQTNTLPPGGNRIAAQLLGFKLRFYASDARDANDNLPDNLIHLAALLIKIGFISLVDLYPHLYPLDEDMPARREKLMKEKKAKEDELSGRTTNALAMAGALPDEGVPAPISRLRESASNPSSNPESQRATPPITEESKDPKETLPEPVDQKVALLRSLLLVGAIPEALFILCRFPWLMEVYPDIHTYLFRIAHESLSKVYEEARPYTPEQVQLLSRRGSSANAPSRDTDYPPRKTLRWAKLEEKDAGDGYDYRFYWDDWQDSVPICQNTDDVLTLCSSLLGLVGIEIGKDALLITKIARIAKKDLTDDSSKPNFRRWIAFSATLLGPSLSYTGENPGVVNEVWDLFKMFDTPTRYMIYRNWFVGPGKQKAQAKFAETIRTTKGLLTRVSATNTREMGRAIAKPAYACPAVVFEKALKQSESYKNMIEPLVECCRYLTYLGYDCLNWTFINLFKDNSRSTVQGDGMLTQAWLQNVAIFMGKAYWRYSLMDPTPVLSFVGEQLSKRHMYGYPILEQLIESMGGIKLNSSLSESQVNGLSAGPLLKAFTLEKYLGDKRHACKLPSKRLIKCLKESNLAAKILISNALELQTYADRPELEDTPLKVLSNNLDNLNLHLEHYLDFLRTNLSVQEFNDMIPGVVELMSAYQLEPEIAFTIARESLITQVNAARAERTTFLTNVRSRSGSVHTVGSPPSESPRAISSKVEDAEMKDAPITEDTEMSDAPANGVVVTPPKTIGYLNPQIESLATEFREKMPEKFGQHMCLNFFITFWQLSLTDIFTSTSMKEIKEYTNAWKLFAEEANGVVYSHDNGSEASKQRKAEVKTLNEKSAAFRLEAKHAVEAALTTRNQLQEEMHHWFSGIPMLDVPSEELHDTLLQDCFLPRIRQSPYDAQFASGMLKFMHELGVPGFRTMKFLDQLFRHKMLVQIFFMCTAREASNLGRFLNEILKELNTWHSSQATYVKLAHGQKGTLPGFGRTFNADRTPSSFLDYEDFRRLLFKWHNRLFMALEICLKSKDFMQIRNGVNIIKAMSSQFPKVDTMGKSLVQIVQHISKNDDRSDVKLFAMSLIGAFKKHERSWITAARFHHSRQPPQAANTPNTPVPSSSEPPKTPQPSDSSSSGPVASATEPETNTTQELGQIATAKAPEEPRESDEKQSLTDWDATGVRGEGQDSTKSTSFAGQGAPSSHNHRNDNGPRAGGSHQHAMQHNNRPDSRGNSAQPGPGNRASHALPARPDSLPSRLGRVEQHRGGDRPVEYTQPNRTDNRTSATAEYGRHDRPREAPRESFGDRREISPGRGPRPRSRSPERNSGWGSRDRDPRDFIDDRSMRPPPRDLRAPPAYHPSHPRDPRDHRESRDIRERIDTRIDTRGPPPPSSMDTRSRLHSTPTIPDSAGPYRRDPQGGDRGTPLPPRPPLDRVQPNAPTTTPDRQAPASDRVMMNPERAAVVFSEDRSRERDRDRDPRRERDVRHPSPRRGEDRPHAPYQNRHEVPRDHRDARSNDRPPHDQTPPPIPAASQRRDESNATAPTGPRGNRNEPPPRVGRDAFLPGHVSRPPAHPVQDPNYGRLNAPAETIPSGPRNPLSDRRDTSRREPEQSRGNPNQQPVGVPTTPAQAPTPAAGTGVHPSRLSQITGSRPPPIQTDVPGAPSGPRASGRTPQGPSGSPLTPRGPPTGPSSSDRNPRRNDGNHLRAINHVLTANAPASTPEERPPTNQPPQIRGRGGTRATNGLSNTPTPAGGSHPGTPNPGRPETQQARGDKSEHPSIRIDGRTDDGRQENRGHRDGRRRGRSRSPERNDRRPDERNNRNGFEEPERASDRERGSGRERRASERDGGRREKERDGRDSKRDRSTRDDGRPSNRNEETNPRRGPPPASEVSSFSTDGRGGDNRGGRGSDRREERNDRRDSRNMGRKRDRGDEPPPHGDVKRTRRSN